MKRYNLILIYSPDLSRMLLCRRKKEPYLGKSNFVGGHAEAGETARGAAYRELFEETGLTAKDVQLVHFMDMSYHVPGVVLEIFVGRMKAEKPVVGDENELYWSGLEHNFFDTEHYAGSGNLGHIVLEAEMFKRELFGGMTDGT